MSRLQWNIVGAYYQAFCAELNCEFTIELRPPYCDRGRYIAKVFPAMGTRLARDFDHQDGWPRYYFDLIHAMREIDAWAAFRVERYQAKPEPSAQEQEQKPA